MPECQIFSEITCFIKEIISTKRGGKKLCLDGFTYTINVVATSKDEISWCCVKRGGTVKCSAVLKTNKQYKNAVLVEQHSHPADQTAVDVEHCHHSMKHKASTTNNKPNQILTFAAAAPSDEVQARLPAADTVKRVFCRVCAAHRPKDPHTLSELIIDGQWDQTTGEHPTNFVLYDNGPDADECVIVFATQAHLQKLDSCDTWCMDGTFAVAPHLFHQLYVIQGHYNGVFLPFAYALLQRKTQTTYEIMLHVLEEAGCDPSVVIVDFEHSVEIALHAMFGDHVNIQYSFYHLTQSIWRKIQSLGLSNLYETNDNFHLFCGQIDALAFLPTDEVTEGMTHLRDSTPDEAVSLIDYLDATYVTGQLRPRAQSDGL